MNIGTTIKKLRRSQDITQEQLAEYLNVTAQAVSRWETGTALPDISQLPVLANIFNVTSDELLGIDIAAKEARIDAIINEAWDYGGNGQPAKAVEIIRNVIKEYPNSHKLTVWLLTSLWNFANTADVLVLSSQTEDEKSEYNKGMKEVTTIGEKLLLECTDDEIRHHAIQYMVYAYNSLGEKDKGIALAQKMPSWPAARENLLEHLYSGTELYKHRRENVIMYADVFLMKIVYLNNAKLDNGSYPFSLDERIIIYHKVLAMYAIIFDDENFGFHHHQLAEINRSLAFLTMKKGDTNATLENLRQAAKHSIEYDINYDAEKEYTTLLFRGYKYGDVYSSMPYNQSHNSIWFMGKSEFDPIRNHEEFIEIENQLKKHAVCNT